MIIFRYSKYIKYLLYTKYFKKKKSTYSQQATAKLWTKFNNTPHYR